MNRMLDDSRPNRDLTAAEVVALTAALGSDEDDVCDCAQCRGIQPVFTDDNGDRGDDEMNRRDLFGRSALENDFASYNQ